MRKLRDLLKRGKGGPTLEQLFDAFVASNRRTEWLEVPSPDNPDIKVYVRKSQRLDYDKAEHPMIKVIDVANVTSGKPGLFKTFMLHVEKRVFDDHIADAVVVENIMNPALEAMLRKHGYTFHGSEFERVAVERMGAGVTLIKKSR